MIDTLRQDALQQAIAAIWEGSRATHLEHIDRLEDAVTSLLDGTLDADRRVEAHRLAHRLAGTVGTFGFHEASRIARAIEHSFAHDVDASTDAALRLAGQVLSLRSELEQPTTSLSDSPLVEARTLLAVGPDTRQRQGLVIEAATRGLRMACAADVSEARRSLATRAVDAVIMLCANEHGRQEPGPAVGPDALDFLSALAAANPAVPVMMIGTFDDDQQIPVRLDIARRGAHIVASATATPGAIIDSACRVLEQVDSADATVLVIDDDPVMLQLIRTMLEPLGYTVVLLSEPERAWQLLETTMPELVVLDVDMPGINGLELCRMLRSDSRWHELPILVLSADRTSHLLNDAFGVGADDFVCKPVVPVEFAMRVRNRLERSRLLRQRAGTDPLTGLPGRHEGQRALDRLLARARREGAPVSVALLDIDHFKSLTDRHGYPAGDLVLRRIAHLLVEAFRTEDVVARWGGDQLLLGLQGLTRAQGLERIDAALASIRAAGMGTVKGETLAVTCSVGVAMFPEDGTDTLRLLDQADAARFEAKRAGRDRVVAARHRADDADEGSAPDGWDGRVADVVVVEDDPAMADLLRHALTAHGHRTVCLADGLEAQQRLTGMRPALRTRVILLDVNLPMLDGYSLLRQFRAEGLLRSTRVILLSVRAHESEILHSFELGAFDFVQKPFSVPVLLQRVRRALSP